MIRAAFPPRGALRTVWPDLAKGLRAAATTLVPFFLAARLERPELAWTALGGWLGTLADPGGARVVRARTVGGFVIAGGIAVALGGVGARISPLAAVLLGLVAFGASLLRALGANGASVGTMTAITFTIAVGRGTTTPMKDALYFAGGAAVAALMSSIVWPIGTHRAVRVGLGRFFRELGIYARALAELTAAGKTEGDPSWMGAARVHRRALRAALEETRATALAIRSRRGGESREGSNLRVLLGLGELSMRLLTATAAELETHAATGAGSARNETVRLAALFDGIARALVEGHTLQPKREERASLAPPPSGNMRLPLPVLLRRSAETAAQALAVACALDAATEDADFSEAAAALDLRGYLSLRFRALFDATSVRSPIFRHGLRAGVAVGAAWFVARLFVPDHASWVVVTTLAVLQPYQGATLTRAVERIIGTVLGCLVAVAVTLLVHSPLGLALVMTPLSVAAVATRPRSYRLFTFFLTPVFVLLAERYPGDYQTAVVRAGASILGGVVALVAALVVFPSSERRRLPDTLWAMIAATEGYAQAVLGVRSHKSATLRTVVDEARRKAGVAIGEAETSLERLLAEPQLHRLGPLRRAGKRSEQADAEQAMQLVTFARRLGGALSALDVEVELLAGDGSDDPLPSSYREQAAAHVHEAMEQVRAHLRGTTATSLGAPPEPPEGVHPMLRQCLLRIARHTTLLAAGEATGKSAAAAI